MSKEYEERAAKIMPLCGSWGGGIVQVKKAYWIQSRDRIISILKQLHKTKKQAKRIKELEEAVMEALALCRAKWQVQDNHPASSWAKEVEYFENALKGR